VSVAKRELRAGEVLDGVGGFTCYGVIDNADVVRAAKLLPMGLSDGCRLKVDVPKDQPVPYSAVELPAHRLCDQLRAEQECLFNPV
jgi:predicted homoserine dehydrogenase-like protein